MTGSNDGQSEQSHRRRVPAQGLYDPRYEHDACGVGFVVNIDGTKSHAIIQRGIQVLENLQHRGAAGADRGTGDGAGLLFQIPDKFLRHEVEALGFSLPKPGKYAVGMFFMPQSSGLMRECRTMVERTAASEGLRVLGWRDVPTDGSVLGKQARESQPFVVQCFFAKDWLDDREVDRKLYTVRKQIQTRASKIVPEGEMFYVPSLSARTIVYKGLMLGPQVPAFYEDLRDERLESALAVVHQRYSTNTFPSWELAQPFRFLAHNGEINTLRGNLNWMSSRERNLRSDVFGADIRKLLPIVEPGGSDSACLDNVLDLLFTGGRSLHHAMSMLIPQAWGAKYPMGPDLRGFYEYHAGIMEPWDGPAAVAFTDGRHVGALLDRNGLRPARYVVTKEGFMVFASEAGVIDLPAESVAERGALRPGQMILVDIEAQRLMEDPEIKMQLARRKPYRRWVEENKIMIHGFFGAVSPVRPNAEALPVRESLFGYTREDRRMILGPMASSGHEPVGSMGSDQPLAVLSEKPQLLYWYFKQLFAQITNPAIDSYREELVMSLMTFLGTPDEILTEVPHHARLVKLRHPFLSNEDLVRIRNLHVEEFMSTTLPIGFAAHGTPRELNNALDRLCHAAEVAVSERTRFIILSDRDLPEDQAPIPALLAVSAVNTHLCRRGKRTPVSLILETGEAREVMHMAVLLGHGASAINPYLAFEVVAGMAMDGELESPLGAAKAIENYVEALCNGLLKIMSKMGISTLRSYRSAQVFEAIGIEQEVMDKHFQGTVSRIGGIGLEGIAREARARHAASREAARSGDSLLPSGGQYTYRLDGERHMWTSETVALLQQATRENDSMLFKQFVEWINAQHKQASTLRGLMKFRTVDPVSLDEVEPVEDIMKRFVTGAMSFGSISREAHETLAIAMNRIGGKSNSGEGGEDPERYVPLPNGDSRCSAIKQVASGRFGVTAEYLVNAKELQIKIAQGAKPGEGGQLPGHKVNAEIARVRHSTPGVTLISPPPHHDIYSIEDIKQLIYDLKNANPDARVSVKLVSEAGVGTIAAGVAKGHADMILISGYDGGTGASPLSSIKHAGLPWELGLSETQQTLVLNGLRTRVRLQTDGQLRTGRDVVIAALLGAEEFGFATSALVVCGCVMMRKCHKNTCPVGVATQNPELRKRFTGKPEHVVNFLRMLAEDVRRTMAQLGFRTMDEMIGRSDVLELDHTVEFWKARGLDFSKILYQVPARPEERRCMTRQQHGIEEALDYEILPRVQASIDTGEKTEVAMPICNVNRTVGTIVSSMIARRYGGKGLPDDTITLRFKGSAGQSFGAFCSKGMTLILEGEANDYLGKGLSGARIVVKPFEGSTYAPEKNVIAGNVLLYGATSGEVYVGGRAGERFAIRNSGARAVVEGVGDHGCEYMTGGRVAILGSTGVNFAAGMSGGIAYVLDETGLFDENCNLDMVDLEQVTSRSDEEELREMIEKHLAFTGSQRAAVILEDWSSFLPKFIKVFPMEYRRALGQMSREDEATERAEFVHD